jgi:putative hydrolase of the HAD superfamily
LAKPDPAAFALMAAGLGVAPGALAYVGDSLDEDAHGAMLSGCIPVLIDRTGKREAASGWLVIRSLG